MSQLQRDRETRAFSLLRGVPSQVVFHAPRNIALCTWSATRTLSRALPRVLFRIAQGKSSLVVCRAWSVSSSQAAQSGYGGETRAALTSRPESFPSIFDVWPLRR